MAKFFRVVVRHQAELQFGARQCYEVALRAVGNARRQLERSPLESQHAYSHIREHFHEQPSKPSHGVFLEPFRKQGELTKLLMRGIDRQGTEAMLSKSDDNDWAVVIQSWFGTANPIGYSHSCGVRAELSYLCIVVDLNGDLITAYPTAKYRLPGDVV